MIVQEQPYPEKRMRGVFEDFGAACSKFVSLVKGTGGGGSVGKTRLDKERHKLLVRELVSINTHLYYKQFSDIHKLSRKIKAQRVLKKRFVVQS